MKYRRLFAKGAFGGVVNAKLFAAAPNSSLRSFCGKSATLSIVSLPPDFLNFRVHPIGDPFGVLQNFRKFCGSQLIADSGVNARCHFAFAQRFDGLHDDGRFGKP